MYFLSYLFKFMPLYFISHFSSWIGLACIVMFLIFIVHSYVAPTLNKLNKKARVTLFDWACVCLGIMQKRLTN